ncbi:MAG: hypothetical protein D6744_01640 [Planctomycetota bacterium]|nr:MAG: hypothetical protein D6744_01640 [Planctomycetota bacterium]
MTAMSPLGLLAQEDVFVRGNQSEAALWLLVAAAFAWYAWRQDGVRRRRCWQAAGVFLAFGISDLAEIRTGGWWKPWWLFAWKAACVVAMVWLLIDDIRRKRAEKATAASNGGVPEAKIPRDDSNGAKK